MARKDRTGNRKTREQQKQTLPPDEEKALQTAARKYEQCLREGKSIPSQMCHATTVHDFQPFALFIPSTQLHKTTIVSKFTWIYVRHLPCRPALFCPSAYPTRNSRSVPSQRESFRHAVSAVRN